MKIQSIFESFPAKIIEILYLDLVPASIVQKWLKHLRNEFPTIAFKASTQTQKQHLVRATNLSRF